MSVFVDANNQTDELELILVCLSVCLSFLLCSSFLSIIKFVRCVLLIVD